VRTASRFRIGIPTCEFSIREIREIRGHIPLVAAGRAVTLANLEKAARAVGWRIKLELIPA
jgi:hypothetical protein